MQGKFADCVPPILISGHQFTIFSHHQDAARKYLEAYKLLPENPLVNLCVGMFFHFMLYLHSSFLAKNKQLVNFHASIFLRNSLDQLGIGFETSK